MLCSIHVVERQESIVPVCLRGRITSFCGDFMEMTFEWDLKRAVFICRIHSFQMKQMFGAEAKRKEREECA